jgi:mono/diheme cytochrome c family protein
MDTDTVRVHAHPQGVKKAMTPNSRLFRRLAVMGGMGALLLAGTYLFQVGADRAQAAPLDRLRAWCNGPGCGCENGPCGDDLGGEWYWVRSPDQEQRVVASLFNRYCIRCHGVDGRGVWDIPGVPDFTNPRWQEMRSDAQRARIILEGRGAVMPPFRGALTLEEAWALGRYLHTFQPGTEVSRPDLHQPMLPPSLDALPPAPKKPEPPAK